MEYISPDERFEFPTDVAVCPICGAPVIVDFDEYETETGQVTECGFHIDCKDGPDEPGDDSEWEDFISSHWSMPYLDWMPLESRLYKWFTARYRLRLPTSGAAELATPSNSGESAQNANPLT